MSASDVLSTLRLAALAQDRLAGALRGHGLTVDRWRVLEHVVAAPGASMSDVADALVMAPATATRAVDALVETGAVYRAADPADRRRVVLHPTAAGAALREGARPLAHAVAPELEVAAQTATATARPATATTARTSS
ncbi:MarR family winged helix-turn-helix transcriptional regulator [Kineococcus esterisolvens]|uniref:MarR family winged helix-turn-helix transcriptional regulator n=1 Tax=Kineococcus sp. SYSU DK025 TaxID=3383146 RepID=UPI003D7E5C7F